MKRFSTVVLSILLLSSISFSAFAAPAATKASPTPKPSAPANNPQDKMQNALSISNDTGKAADQTDSIDITEKIKNDSIEYTNQLERLKTRLRSMYENSGGSFLGELVKSKSLFDCFQKIQVMAQITRQDQNLLREMEMNRQQIQLDQKIAEALTKDRSTLRVSMNEFSRSNMSDELEMKQKTMSLVENQEDELVKTSTEISGKIQKMQGLEPYVGGTMVWPIPSSSRITSNYGMRIHPILKKAKMHTGIDIGGAYGTSWVAANSGRVVVAEYLTGYGKCVIIDHGGQITTLYAHMSSILVKKGQSVEINQVIGKVGSTGWSTGPHGHFEVRKNGGTVKPLEFVSPPQ